MLLSRDAVKQTVRKPMTIKHNLWQVNHMALVVMDTNSQIILPPRLQHPSVLFLLNTQRWNTQININPRTGVWFRIFSVLCVQLTHIAGLHHIHRSPRKLGRYFRGQIWITTELGIITIYSYMPHNIAFQWKTQFSRILLCVTVSVAWPSLRAVTVAVSRSTDMMLWSYILPLYPSTTRPYPSSDRVTSENKQQSEQLDARVKMEHISPDIYNDVFMRRYIISLEVWRHSVRVQFKGHYSGILVISGVCLCEERVEETCQMRLLHSVGFKGKLNAAQSLTFPWSFQQSHSAWIINTMHTFLTFLLSVTQWL